MLILKQDYNPELQSFCKPRIFMPANLNALIRYKTIDRCLRNRFLACDIERLRIECSEALGEFRGVYKKVSERTIRDDIRVLRSEILGFHAPIVCEGGYYSYSDPEYSIFGVSVIDQELLRLILKILLKNRQVLKGAEVDRVIHELTRLTSELSIQEPAFSLEPDQQSLADKAERSALLSEDSGAAGYLMAKRVRINLKKIRHSMFEAPIKKEESVISGVPSLDHKAGCLYENEGFLNYRWGFFLDLIGCR